MYFKGLHICPCTFQNLNSIVNWRICGIIYGELYHHWKGHSHTNCNLRCWKLDTTWWRHCRQQAKFHHVRCRWWRSPNWTVVGPCPLQTQRWLPSFRLYCTKQPQEQKLCYICTLFCPFLQITLGRVGQRPSSATIFYQKTPIYKGCAGKRGTQDCIGICMQGGAGRGISHQMLSRYKCAF